MWQKDGVSIIKFRTLRCEDDPELSPELSRWPQCNHKTPNNRESRVRLRGFPGGAVVENLPANAGDTGSSPGLGRSHMPRGN